jgi:exopolysaccharide biosynthesis polyprenyl glycosylphosphotransferase
MARLLAVAETTLLFVAATIMNLLWGHTTIVDWIDVANILISAAVMALCCGVAFYYNDLYDLRITRSGAVFATRLIQSIGVAFILLAVFYKVFPDTRPAESAFVSSFLVVGLLLVPLRAGIYAASRSRPLIERVLILGASELTLRIIDEIDAQPHLGYDIVGIIDDGGEARLALDGRLIGPLHGFSKIVKDTNTRRIIVALAERRGRLPVAELLECQGRDIIVEDGVQAYERLTGKVPIQWVAPSQLLFSEDLRRPRRYDRIARAFMRLLALIGLVVSAPLLLLICAAIKLESRGPVLFVQERIGLFGRTFRLLKFRTMVPEPRPTSEWVCDNARRITRVGKWLRKFRLDELPQFINIVRGDMALIGPRPHPASNYALFADQIPHYALRCRVRPGVTGWAQVRYGYANNLEEETEKMRFDLYYIKHVSLYLDLRILFDTVKTVLFGRSGRATEEYEVDTLVKVAGR